MKAISKFIIVFLSIFFPKLKSLIREELIDYEYVDMERNSKCYCNSWKKYKHCHLVKNEKKNKVAFRRLDNKGNEKVIVISKRAARKTKGISGTNIKVKNTFSEIDVALGASSK